MSTDLATFRVGDRVTTAEGDGTVSAVFDAASLYPSKPLVKKTDLRTPQKKTKYPPGTHVYQVVLDRQPNGVFRSRTTNFIESQISRCPTT